MIGQTGRLWQFLSTLSLRRATSRPRLLSGCRAKFLSTLSLRRATKSLSNSAGSVHNFYPRSPCGERLQQKQHKGAYKNISIHALLAESDHSLRWEVFKNPISIHALLAESDRDFQYEIGKTYEISIHALLAESDLHRVGIILLIVRFLSTLSLRRATIRNELAALVAEFLSTLSLRRATSCPSRSIGLVIFLSTLSLRRATHSNAFLRGVYDISIHALLAESDGNYSR